MWRFLVLLIFFVPAYSYSYHKPLEKSRWSCSAISLRGGYWICMGGSSYHNDLFEAEDESISICEFGCNERCVVSNCIFQ